MRQQGNRVLTILSLSMVQLIGWTIPVFAQYQSYVPQSSYPAQAASRMSSQYAGQPQYQNQYSNNQSYQSAAPNIYGGQTNAAGQAYLVGGKPASQQSFQAAQLMTQAVNLLNQNQNNDALPLFEKALALAPDVALGHSITHCVWPNAGAPTRPFLNYKRLWLSIRICLMRSLRSEGFINRRVN